MVGAIGRRFQNGIYLRAVSSPEGRQGAVVVVGTGPSVALVGATERASQNGMHLRAAVSGRSGRGLGLQEGWDGV